MCSYNASAEGNLSLQLAHLQVRESSWVGALDCEVVAVDVEEAGVVPSLEVELSPPDATVLLSGAVDMISPESRNAKPDCDR
jgi:hypothetical protein